MIDCPPPNGETVHEERRMRVAKLAQGESRARQRFEALGAGNTAHLTADEKVALDIEYALSRAEWYEALGYLRDAIEPGETAISLIRATGRHFAPT